MEALFTRKKIPIVFCKITGRIDEVSSENLGILLMETALTGVSVSARTVRRLLT
jgi:hypothetical protein